MRVFRRSRTVALPLAFGLIATAASPQSTPDSGVQTPVVLQAAAEQLLLQANQARAAAGVGSLQLDPALSAAALQHCLRMAENQSVAHRFEGEPDLATRAGDAGAHFSLIEENVALDSRAGALHKDWMLSPHHRANLLNPEADRVGIAVVVSSGFNYAVADYARAVPQLTRAQVEAAFAGLLRARGLTILKNQAEAREYCALSGAAKRRSAPNFRMLWQNADVNQLPPQLVDQLASGKYESAVVGSCPPNNLAGSFTVYRVAVLLYGSSDATHAKPWY